MAGGRLRPGFFLVLLISGTLALPCQGKTPKSKNKQSAKPDKVVVPVAAPVPLSPEQMPASPPQVAFRDGQLTIMAKNSTLVDILRDVRTQTGAFVDLPGNATERVVGQFGPGPARDVLATLLNGSHFNYVLLGSPTDAAALDRVILISISGGAERDTQSNAAIRPATPPPENDGAELPDEPADQPQEGSNIFASSDDQNNGQPVGPDQENSFGQGGPFGQQPGSKMPEQMLQELQQRQQHTQPGSGTQPASPNAFPTPGGSAPAPGPQ
jgi:hypothetical protein